MELSELLRRLGVVRREGSTTEDIRDALVRTFTDEFRARQHGVEVDDKVRAWVEDCAANIAAGVYMLAKEED